MHILIITLYYLPEPVADSLIMSGLAATLADMGHEVTILASFPHYTWGRIQDSYRGQLFTEERMGKIRVIRTWVYPSKKGSRGVARIVTGVTFLILGILLGRRVGDCDAILVYGYPTTNGLLGYLLSKYWRVPFVYNVQDLYPDIFIALGLIKEGFLSKMIQYVEGFYYRKSKYVSVISTGFKQRLAARGVPKDKVAVISNLVDTDFIRPMPGHNTFRAKYGLDGKYVVMYAGNIGLSQGLDIVLQSAKRLMPDKEILFVLVGEGAAKKDIIVQAEQLGLDNVIFAPFEPQENVPFVLGAADIQLLSLRRGLGVGSVPSKLYPIMAAERPVIASVDQDSDTWCEVEKAQCGLCVPPEDPVALTEAVIKLRNDHNLSTKLARQGREYVVLHRSNKVIAKLYEELFNPASLMAVKE